MYGKDGTWRGSEKGNRTYERDCEKGIFGDGKRWEII